MRRCVKYRRDIHNLMGVGDDVFVWVSWAPENHLSSELELVRGAMSVCLVLCMYVYIHDTLLGIFTDWIFT